ncbi:MAG: hypothetical protein ABIR06_12930 [Cyclobacteriaceae bacterium]
MKRIAITIFAIGLLTSAIGQQLSSSVNALNKIVPENAAFGWSSLSFYFW